MRILITADPFIPIPPKNYGGIERIIHFLVEELINMGFEVALVAHKDSDVKALLFPYAETKSGISTLSHIENIRSISSTRKFKPDVVHSFSRLAYLLPYLRSSTPKIMSYQREPTISQIMKTCLFAKNETLFFTGCSDYISNKIEPFASCATIYNGVAIENYDFVSEVSETSPLVFLGRIEFIKGAHTAVEVALKTNQKLVIAGNIPEDNISKEYFSTMIEPYIDGTQISYIGKVNDVEKNILLGNAKALLMPIEWNEPFGIVMAEALACGTPVLGFPKGAVKEVVINGINGFLATDINELCECVGKIPKLNREDSRKSAENKFSSRVIVKQYLNLYTSLIKRK